MGQSGVVDPDALASIGNHLLEDLLGPAGFQRRPAEGGAGSGGTFTVARWTRGSQYIELHVRQALGIVRYGWGSESFDQAHVLGALGHSRGAYPGFSDDPVDGFRHPAEDLAGPLRPVIVDPSTAAHDAARAYTPPTPSLP